MRTTFASAFALALLSTTSVMAADLYGARGGSIKDAPIAYEPAEPRARPIFYLRADATYSHNAMSSLFELPNYELSHTSIGNNWAYGFGAGLYLSKNIRMDVTWDHRRNADIRGSVNDGLATFGGERQFGVQSNVYLANIYYNFNAQSHFSPYVGVGLGFAQNKTSDGRVVVNNGCAITACDPRFDGAKETSAAAALMAGFTVRLHDRLSLDAGYRFLYLGDAHTGNIRNVAPTPVAGYPAAGTDPIVSDLNSHEFRVGIRWDIK